MTQPLALSLFFIFTVAILYASAFVFHGYSFRAGDEKGNQKALIFMRAAFLLSTLYFVIEAIEQSFFLPVFGIVSSLSFFAWSLAFVYLVLLAPGDKDSFGLLVAPFLAVLTLLAFVLKLMGPEAAVPNSLRGLVSNPYFAIHIISVFFAYASFTLSFVAGILYLIQRHELKTRRAGNFYHKLPSLEEIERLIYQPIFWGVALLFSAVLAGFIWAYNAFDKIWLGEPKTIATSIILTIYAFILALHWTGKISGRRGAVITVVAFFLVIVNFVGVRFLQGSHPF